MDDREAELLCRQVQAWHAYLEASGLPTSPREDLEQYEELRSPVIDEEITPRVKKCYLDAGDLDAVITLSPELFHRIWKVSDGTIQYHVRRALEQYADTLEAQEAATPIGSKPSSVPRTALPKAVDPVPKNDAAEWAKLVRERRPAEALALAEKLRRKTS